MQADANAPYGLLTNKLHCSVIAEDAIKSAIGIIAEKTEQISIRLPKTANNFKQKETGNQQKKASNRRM